MAERKVLNPPVDAKGDYERVQARQYLANERKKIEQKYDIADANARGGQSNKNRVQKALQDDAVYASLLADEKKLASGQLSDDMILRYARSNVTQRQKKEDRSHETQEKIDKSFETVREKGGTIDDVGQEMINQGGSYTRIGPDGFVAWDKLVGGFGAKPLDKGVFDAGKLREYGNNYFTLFTYYNGLGPDTQLVADGVMTELPAVSMSTEWDNAPASSIGEELDKALNNEFLEFMSMKTTNANSPIMRRKDQLTARCYKDTGDVGFEIKFRVYPGQTVGTQRFTTAKEWLLLLSMTTPINAACTFSIDNTLGKIVNAADGVAAAFKELGDLLRNGNKKDDSRTSDQKSSDRTRAFTSIEGAITQGNTLTSFGNEDARISNPNVFGACLFGLRIYPWIFRKPITVYIDNWSVTPSKEWNNDVNDHYYYDFTLSCKMDQKPSAATWVDSLLV